MATDKRLNIELRDQRGSISYFHVDDARRYTARMGSVRLRRYDAFVWDIHLWSASGWRTFETRIRLDPDIEPEEVVEWAWNILYS